MSYWSHLQKGALSQFENSVQIFISSHLPMMDQQNQVTLTNWPASKKNATVARRFTERERALVSEIHASLRSHINLLNLISSFPLFHGNCQFLCVAGHCSTLSGGFASKVMVRPGLRRRRRCGVCRQVSNKFDGVKFAGFAGLPWKSLVPKRAVAKHCACA